MEFSKGQWLKKIEKVSTSIFVWGKVSPDMYLNVHRMIYTYICFYIYSRCRYNAIQYNTILHTSLQWLRQNINENLDTQKTPCISPVRESYGWIDTNTCRYEQIQAKRKRREDMCDGNLIMIYFNILRPRESCWPLASDIYQIHFLVINLFYVDLDTTDVSSYELNSK